MLLWKHLEEKVRSIIEVARASHSKKERGSAKVAERSEESVTMSEATDAQPGDADVDWNLFVKRTFLHVPIPCSFFSSLSAQPRTV